MNFDDIKKLDVLVLQYRNYCKFNHAFHGSALNPDSDIRATLRINGDSLSVPMTAEEMAHILGKELDRITDGLDTYGVEYD